METIKGYVKKIKYKHNSGYSVIILDTKEGNITCTGYLNNIFIGDYIEVIGYKKIHPTYGLQFQINKTTIIHRRKKTIPGCLVIIGVALLLIIINNINRLNLYNSFIETLLSYTPPSIPNKIILSSIALETSAVIVLIIVIALKKNRKENYGLNKITYNEYQEADKLTFIAFDLETTGLSYDYHEIIEIGAAKVINGEITATFSQLIKPKNKVPKEATKINGITNEMLLDKPTIDIVLPIFISFIGNEKLIAHNATFDMGFLINNCRKIGINIENVVTDTLALSKKIYPRMERYNLTHLTTSLKIDHNEAHRALSDAMAVMNLYLKCYEIQNSQNIEYIKNDKLEEKEFTQKFYLNIPFLQKDEAKKLGAKWDSNIKKWYINDSQTYHLFGKWFSKPFSNLIIFDSFYVAITTRECFKCGESTPVIMFASDNFVSIEYDGEDSYSTCFNDALHFIYEPSELPKLLEKHLRREFNYRYGYSQTIKSYYYGNHCSNCDTLQGNFYVAEHFTVFDEESAKQFKFQKINLSTPLELTAGFIWGSADEFLKEYSTIENLDLDF